MSTPRIGVILSTTRDGRLADKAGTWLMDHARQRDDLEFELIDLRDFSLPFFNEMSPAYAPVKNEAGQKWQAKIGEFDGYIWVTAEYNNSFAGVFKNAIDYAYNEWVKKPVAFLGYGGVGGARAIQHLRHVAIELQMAPIRHSVNIGGGDFMAVMQGQKQIADLDYLVPAAKDLFDNLAWWTATLKDGREA